MNLVSQQIYTKILMLRCVVILALISHWRERKSDFTHFTPAVVVGIDFSLSNYLSTVRSKTPEIQSLNLYRHWEKLVTQITQKLWLSFINALLFIFTINSELCNQQAVALRPHAVSFLCTYSWNVLSLGPFSA